MEKDKEGGQESPPLQLYSKWYVLCTTLFASLTAEQTQLPGCSQVILPTHRARRCARRLLRDTREGGGRVWYCYKRYDEDFNITSISKFVCRSSPDYVNHLTWPVPCRQFYFRDRCPFGPPTGSERTIRTPPPRNSHLMGGVGGAHASHGHRLEQKLKEP